MGPVEDTIRGGIRSEPWISLRVGVSNSHTTDGTRESGGLRDFTET